MLDLWGLMQASLPKGDGWNAFLSDGLHLSPLGQKFVAEELIKLIAKQWPELAITPCPITGSSSNSGSRSALPIELPTHDLLDSRKEHAEHFAQGVFLARNSNSTAVAEERDGLQLPAVVAALGLGIGIGLWLHL